MHSWTRAKKCRQASN